MASDPEDLPPPVVDEAEILGELPSSGLRLQPLLEQRNRLIRTAGASRVLLGQENRAEAVRDLGVIGTVMLAAPGIPDGSSVTVGYTPEQGLAIGGEVPLNTDRIPGVTGARMSVLVRRRPDSGEWSVNGSGTAQFALPGVTGSLTVSWADGILSVGGMGIVKRDPMTGSVSFLVTNQPIDEEGNPIDRTVEGFHARVVQHECDHLDGILYPQRMTDMSTFGFTRELFPDEEIADD